GRIVIDETACLCPYASATSRPELHGPVDVERFWRGPPQSLGGFRGGEPLRADVLPCQCPRFPGVGGHRRFAFRETHSVAGLLPASHLVPVSVRRYHALLCAGAGQALRSLSRLAGNAVVPPRLSESRAALARRRPGQLARNRFEHAHPVPDLPVAQAR